VTFRTSSLAATSVSSIVALIDAFDSLVVSLATLQLFVCTLPRNYLKCACAGDAVESHFDIASDAIAAFICVALGFRRIG